MAKKKQQPIEPEEESEDIEFEDFDNDAWIQLASATLQVRKRGKLV